MSDEPLPAQEIVADVADKAGRYAKSHCSKEDEQLVPAVRANQSLAAATVLESQLVSAGAWLAAALF